MPDLMHHRSGFAQTELNLTLEQNIEITGCIANAKDNVAPVERYFLRNFHGVGGKLPAHAHDKVAHF